MLLAILHTLYKDVAITIPGKDIYPVDNRKSYEVKFLLASDTVLERHTINIVDYMLRSQYASRLVKEARRLDQ